jgi:hypothetical protein
MNLPGGVNKWGSAALAVVCIALVANLARQYRGMQPGHYQNNASLTGTPPAPAKKSPAHGAEDLAQFNPAVHLDALKALDSRPLPAEPRNPFDFVGGAPPPPQMAAPAPRPLPPPPPPPLPLKAVGYNEMPGGQKEAMVTYNNDLNVVHEGDVIGAKYKVLSISSNMVVVEDGSTHEKLDLPIPQ